MSRTKLKEQPEYVRLLPEYISKWIPEEEKDWKEQIFRNLPKAIELDIPEDIDFWMNCIDVFISSKTFTFTNEEKDDLFIILYRFITSSQHWKLVSSACATFMSLYRNHVTKLSFVVDWKELYKILQKLSISRSKKKRSQPPQTLFTNLINLLRIISDHFEKNCTHEMLELWMPSFDPRNHSFVLSHCLMCHFLPTNTNDASLWFEKFIGIWPMFRSEVWDFQWLLLFTKLSWNNISTIDWNPHVPFIFNALSYYLNIPMTLLEAMNPNVNDYPIDLYRIFFSGVTSAHDLYPLFSDLIINLLSSSAKLSVRKHFEKVLFMLQPYCAPVSQTDEDISNESITIFLSILINQYFQKVKYVCKYGNKGTEYLTQDDHDWFVSSLLPLIKMERFSPDPRISMINYFALLSPSIALPSFLETVTQSFEYERLLSSALKTLITLMPVIASQGNPNILVSDFVQRAIIKMDTMDTDHNIKVFALTAVYINSYGIIETEEDMVLNLMGKTLDFLDRLNEADYNAYGDNITYWMSVAAHFSSLEMLKKMTSLFISRCSTMQLNAVSDLVHSFGSRGITFIENIGYNAKKKHEYAILYGILKDYETSFLPKADIIVKLIEDGIHSSEKEIVSLSMKCLRTMLQSMLQTLPLVKYEAGFVNQKDIIVRWHSPSNQEVELSVMICQRFIQIAKSFLSKEDSNEQLKGNKILASIAKGLRCSISNNQLDVVLLDNLAIQPKMHRYFSEELLPYWKEVLELFISSISLNSHDKVLSYILKLLPKMLVVKDPTGLKSNDNTNYYKALKEVLCGDPINSIVMTRVIVRKAIHLYSYRHAVTLVPYVRYIDQLLPSIIPICCHPSSKVRNRCALFIQDLSAAFPDHFGSFFQQLINKTEESLTNLDALSGLASSLSSCCQLVFTEQNFAVIAKAALAVCRMVSNDIPDDSVRSLRQILTITFDFVDFTEKRFNKEEYLEIRQQTAKQAMERVKEPSIDREVLNYATALVISMTNGFSDNMDCELYKFMLERLAEQDSQLYDIVLQSLPGYIEQLIPRIPKSSKVSYEKVTPENYDQFKFTDRFLPGLSTTQPLFLNHKELIDINIVGKYFNNPEERVQIHNYLIHLLYEETSFLRNIFQSLIHFQVHQEESYSKIRVQFWVSLIRFLGHSFAIKLIHEMEQLTSPNSPLASHVIAGELFSSIMFSIKGWKYSQIEAVKPYLLPFISRVVIEGESDFQSVWFVSIVCGISDHDPRRYYWLFEQLISIIPSSINQIRDVKIASLVVDIVLEFGWRIPDLISPIVHNAIIPMFQEHVQTFEQTRECSIRAVSSLFSSYFLMNDNTIDSTLQSLFDQIVSKTGDQFLIAWITAQFTTQTLSSFIINRLAINKIGGWLDIVLGKTEDEEKRARVCLLHLVRSNWIWSLANRPITKESALPIIRQVLDQLSFLNRAWQAQAIILFLLSAFIESNYFLINDTEIDMIISNYILPALESSNYDVQDSAGEVLTFMLKSSERLKNRIGNFISRFCQNLFGKESTYKKLAGAKGLISIISSTQLFDSVPDYIIEAFSALTEAQNDDATLKPVIIQALSDFWSIHESNVTADVVDALSRFKDSARPSYFC